MKDGRYIGIHTQVRFWLPRDRPFTELEALISHTLDIEEKKTYSINGYSKLWQWSRNKVRSFLENIRTPKGHHRDTHQDTQRTSTGQGIVLKLNNLQAKEDTQGTSTGQGEGQLRDSQRYTTIYPKPNPLNPKPNPKDLKEKIYKKEKVDIPDWLPLEAWHGFVEMRNKIKKPLTDRAIKLSFDKLLKFKEEGQNIEKILDQSVSRCYQGLFPVKDSDDNINKPKTFNEVYANPHYDDL